MNGEGRRRGIGMEHEGISKEEVGEAIAKLKESKAAGAGGIEGEYMKYGIPRQIS